jgi:DNA repair protein RadD
VYIEENLQLREPQVEAKLYEFFQSGRKTAVVQIPVSCGKSGIAAIAPFGIAPGPSARRSFESHDQRGSI